MSKKIVFVLNKFDLISMVKVVEYTFFGSSPSLLIKRKKVVSMPNVSRMINNDTYA